MRTDLFDIIVLKVIGLLALPATVVTSQFWEGPLPFFGTTAYTVGAAIAGSLIAFAYGTPVVERRRLWGYAVGGVFIGIWGTQLLPHYFAWSWYIPEMSPPLAGFLALVSRWAVPFVVEVLPAFVRRWAGLDPKGSNTGGKP